MLLDVFENEPIFSETTSNDLIFVCSNTFADQSVLKTVKTAEQLGRAQFEAFFSEKLKNPSVISVLSPISRNKLPFFSFRPVSKKKVASSLKVSALKTDCELFSRLYIACHCREGNLDVVSVFGLLCKI
jgi:hypothetical protein